MNDVTRDFGQALGVAVNGSIAAIGYTQVLKATCENVPEPQRVQISQDVATIILSSLSGALEIAKKYPGIDAEKLVEAAKHAFLVGQLEAMLLSSILCFTGAIIIFLFFPRKHI